MARAPERNVCMFCGMLPCEPDCDMAPAKKRGGSGAAARVEAARTAAATPKPEPKVKNKPVVETFVEQPPIAPVVDLAAAMKAAMTVTPYDKDLTDAIRNLEPILHQESLDEVRDHLGTPEERAERWRGRNGKL